MPLTRDEILNANDIRIETVSVPEWGGDVLVRVLGGSEVNAYQQSMMSGTGQMSLANMYAKLVAKCVCDDKGQRLFTDADVRRLGEKSSIALKRVFDRCQTLNGLTATAVEEAEKNSESSLSDASCSG